MVLLLLLLYMTPHIPTIDLMKTAFVTDYRNLVNSASIQQRCAIPLPTTILLLALSLYLIIYILLGALEKRAA